jgi:hypothetical protein
MSTGKNNLDVCIEIPMLAPPSPPPPSPLSTLSTDSNTGLQCYICLCEQNPTMESYCQCKATVHKECLIKSINALQSTTCSICKTEIRNVETVRAIKSLNVGAFVVMATPFALSACILGIAVIFITSAYADANHSRAKKLHIAAWVFLGTFCFGVFLSSFYAHYLNRTIRVFVYTFTYRFKKECIY